jgi:hypothetical protein
MTTATNLDLFTQPTPSTPAAKWARWISTPEGQALFAEIERRALAEWHRGAQRVEVNRIVADLRAERRVSIDNSIRSCISDALVERYPVLDPLIERRRRRSA